MPGRIKMILIGGTIFILLGIASFILLTKFYYPLNRYLFGGEFEISPDEIQFWVKKMPKKNYFRVYIKYLKSPTTTADSLDFSHPVFYSDNKSVLGFDEIYFNPEDNKIYGGGSTENEKWEWVLYHLGEGKIENGIFKPVFPIGTSFTFHLLGILDFPTPSDNCITIHLPGTLKKLTKQDLKGENSIKILEDSDFKKRDTTGEDKNPRKN